MAIPRDPVDSWRRLRRIQAVTTELSRAGSREDAAEAALAAAIEVMDADAGLVALATEDGAHIRFLHSVGYPPEEDESLDDVPIPIDRPTPTVRAAATGQPFFAADAAAVVAQYPSFADKVRRTGFEAAAYLPMRGVHRVLGAFHVVYRTRHPFTDEEVSLLTTIADQCAVAMEREIHLSLVHEREAELEEMQRALIAERDRSAALLHALRDGFFVMDAEAKLLELGDRFCEIVGYERSVLLGRSPPYPFFPRPGPDLDRATSSLTAALRGEATEFDLRLVRGDGVPVHALVTVSALRDEEGAISEFVGTIKDVTQRRRSQTQLERLQGLGQRLATARTSEEVARALLDEIDRSIATDVAAVAIVDDGEEAIVLDATGLSDAEAPGWGSFWLEPGGPVSDSILHDRIVVVGSPEIRLAYPAVAHRYAQLGIASTAIFPLSGPTGVLGALILSFRESRTLDAEESGTTSALARQAGQSLERTRNDAAEAAARDRVQRLQDVTNALGVAIDVSQVCEVAGAATRGASEADAVAVLLRAAGGRRLRIRYALGFSESELRDLRGPSALDEPLWLESAEDVALHDRSEDGDRGLGAKAILPLTQGADVTGVLILGFRNERTIRSAERDLLLAIARQTSQALDRASLYAAQARSTREAERYAMRTAQLQTVTAALSGVSTMNDVLKEFVENGARIANAVGSWVLLADADATILRTVAAFGSETALFDNSVIAADSDDGVAECFRTRAARWVGSLDAYVKASPQEMAPSVTCLGGIAMVPLGIRERPIGVFALQFARPRRFKAPDRAFIEAIAEQGGNAVERAKLFDEGEAARRQAEYERSRIERLQRATARMARASSAEEAAEVLLTTAREVTLAAGGRVLLAEEDGSLREVASVGASPSEVDGSLPSTAVVPATREETEGPGGDAPARAGGAFTVPLLAAGSRVGILELRFTNGVIRSAEDRDLVTTLASQAAVTLRRARTYEVEHEVASTLQAAMLPAELPQPKGFRVQGRYRAATEHLDVGGDWFDAVELDHGRLALVVGDVVGRGLPAATAMGQLRTAWRALVVHGAEPGEAIEGLDAFAASTVGAECTTVAGAVIDPERAVVRYACAGHLPPLILSRDGRVRFLTEGRRPPLAVSDVRRLVEGIEPIDPGDSLLLYTDGLVERRNETLDDGLARLSTIASALVDHPPDRLADELIDRLTKGSSLADDVALLVVRCLPSVRHATPARPDQLVVIRAEMRTWLEAHGVSDPVIDDVVLATGEAASNALEHAYAGQTDGGPLEWGMWLDPGQGIVVSIRDGGTWRGSRTDPDRGNGLKLIRALMDDVEIDTSPEGTTVTMSRRIDERGAVV